MHMRCFFDQFKLLWKFFGFFQTPFIRIWHVLAIVFVWAQLIKIVREPFIDSWHIELGLLLVPFVCIFLIVSLKRRGFKYFFPYLWADTVQLRKDIEKVSQGNIPAPRPGGLPGVIQGFGFVSFFLTVAFGFIWYLLWESDPKLSVDFLDYHRYAAYALAIYAIGHGFMALCHFNVWKKSQAAKKK